VITTPIERANHRSCFAQFQLIFVLVDQSKKDASAIAMSKPRTCVYMIVNGLRGDLAIVELENLLPRRILLRWLRQFSRGHVAPPHFPITPQTSSGHGTSNPDRRLGQVCAIDHTTRLPIELGVFTWRWRSEIALPARFLRLVCRDSLAYVVW
jgi:hypothetical protein